MVIGFSKWRSLVTITNEVTTILVWPEEYNRMALGAGDLNVYARE